MNDEQAWFVRKGDKVHGPFTVKQLKQLASSGKIKPDSEVRRGESGSFVHASKVKGLFTQLVPVGPPSSEESKSNPVAWKESPRAPEVRGELVTTPLAAPIAVSSQTLPTARTTCPFCGEDIAASAIKCRYCNEFLDGRPREQPAPPAPAPVPMMPFAQPINVNVIQQTHVGMMHPRWSPGVAMVLSFFIPGLGQMYKGQVLNGLVWFVVVVIGYLAFVIPGVVLHLCCIVGAGMGDPYR